MAAPAPENTVLLWCYKSNNLVNNANNYGSSEVDVTPESSSTVSAGMEQ
jgi:hypothetical protein